MYFKKILVIVTLTVGASLCSPIPLHAQGMSLNQMLAYCNSNPDWCKKTLEAYGPGLAVALDTACPPQELSLDEMENIDLNWLRDAAAKDPNLASGDWAVAEGKAEKALWPCND